MIEHSIYEVWSPVRVSDADLRYQEATGRTSSSTSLNDAMTYAMVWFCAGGDTVNSARSPKSAREMAYHMH